MVFIYFFFNRVGLGKKIKLENAEEDDIGEWTKPSWYDILAIKEEPVSPTHSGKKKIYIPVFIHS